MERLVGTIERYDAARRLGYLLADAPPTRYFFVRSSVEGPMPRAGDPVEFSPSRNHRGPKAIAIRPLDAVVAGLGVQAGRPPAE